MLEEVLKKIPSKYKKVFKEYYSIENEIRTYNLNFLYKNIRLIPKIFKMKIEKDDSGSFFEISDEQENGRAVINYLEDSDIDFTDKKVVIISNGNGRICNWLDKNGAETYKIMSPYFDAKMCLIAITNALNNIEIRIDKTTDDVLKDLMLMEYDFLIISRMYYTKPMYDIHFKISKSSLYRNKRVIINSNSIANGINHFGKYDKKEIINMRTYTIDNQQQYVFEYIINDNIT